MFVKANACCESAAGSLTPQCELGFYRKPSLTNYGYKQRRRQDPKFNLKSCRGA